MPREMIPRLRHAQEGRGHRQPSRRAARRDAPRADRARRCDEILAGQHDDMFPLHVWMTGSGTQFNMNVNEVISNRCCQLAGTPLGSKTPVHPNDHVNMSQSSNDTFPSAMYIAAATGVTGAAAAGGDGAARRDRGEGRAVAGHRQDRPHPPAGRHAAHARPGMVGLCRRCSPTISSASTQALPGVYRLALGGTAVGTGINAAPGFAEAAAAEIAQLDRPAVRHRAEQVRRAGRARRAGRSSRARCARWPCRSTRSARHPPDLERPARRASRELLHARERAGLVDHAGQGQPDAGRGADHGRGRR